MKLKFNDDEFELPDGTVLLALTPDGITIPMYKRKGMDAGTFAPQNVVMLYHCAALSIFGSELEEAMTLVTPFAKQLFDMPHSHGAESFDATKPIVIGDPDGGNHGLH